MLPADTDQSNGLDVNDDDMIRAVLAGRRVDVLITDRPGAAARIRAEHGSDTVAPSACPT